MSDGKSETTSEPGYWMHETSGVLRPVIKDYLDGNDLSPQQCSTMRAYLRQWIAAPVWQGAFIDELRRSVNALTSRDAIEVWLDAAEQVGIDPL